jgi:hypothetical protein
MVTARPVEEVAWRQKARGIKKAGARSGGTDRLAPAAQYLGMPPLVTALAQLPSIV